MMDGPVVKTTSNLGNVTSLEWRVLPRGNGGVEVSLVPRRRSDGCLSTPFGKVEEALRKRGPSAA